MKLRDSRKEIKIYLNSKDEFEKVPLYKVLVDKFLKMDITGCTIIKSNSGYGSNLKLKFSDDLLSTLLQKESTVILTVIESEKRIEEIIKVLDEFIGDGIVTIKDVEFIRYTKTKITPEDIRLAEGA
ncbi:MAG: DUF190 domain-containing protein [Leptospiraceae bacterium]|nr:DUF190 domain-containing protein [Leptospiraceae bacterium]MCK6380415.1 DUF190 domain-containing protein [Leptospiraceae bacterium]NUM41189.1 DUF190 domain-containing protein [Leptospiraceae bacterium]